MDDNSILSRKRLCNTCGKECTGKQCRECYGKKGQRVSVSRIQRNRRLYKRRNENARNMG